MVFKEVEVVVWVLMKVYVVVMVDFWNDGVFIVDYGNNIC